MQKIKKPTSILLAVLMVVSLFTVVPFTASAAEAFSGEGTAENPYLITSADDWNALASSVNSSSSAESYSGKYFKLTDDISVSTMIGKNNHAGSPAQTNLKSFCGIFDGDGHTINVNINSASTHGAAPFSATKNATIKNLTVTGTVNGGIHSSGLVGVPNGTLTVENVTVSAAVTADRYLGGFVGHNFDATTVIKSSIFNGSLTNSSTTKQYIGGFIGWGGLNSSNPANITLDGCLFDGTYSEDKTNNFNPVGYCVDTYCGVTLNNFYTTVDSYGTASGIRVVSGSAQEIQAPVAQVMTSSTSVFYDDFSAAITNWTDGSTLTLLADVTMNSTINVTGTQTLDLNGYGIKMTGNGNVINVGSANLTLNDSNPSQTHKFDPPSGGVGLATLNEESGTLTIYGGYITGGRNVDYGGGILVGAGCLTMNGGNIIGNQAASGGGVSVKGGAGTFTLNGGSVSYNACTNFGGGIMSFGSGGSPSEGLLRINGGSVQYNTCSKGGGIFSQTAMELSGSPNISGNKANGKDGNLTFYGNTNKPESYKNCIIKVTSELTPDTPIGVTRLTTGEGEGGSWDTPCAGVFTASENTSLNGAGKFKSDDESYIVGKNADGQLLLGVPRTVTWKMDNGSTIDTTTVANGGVPTHADPTKEDDDNTYTFSGWTPAVEAVTADATYTATFDATPYVASVTSNGTTTKYTDFVAARNAWTEGTTLTLLSDIEMTELQGDGYGILVDKTKTLDLNGKTLSIASSVSRNVERVIGVIGGELTIKDSSGTNDGRITGASPSVDNGSSAGLYINRGGTATMYGGTITGNTTKNGAGVWIDGRQPKPGSTEATFNMYGGVITGNTAENGGGVYVGCSGDGTGIGHFNMFGGTITGNTATTTGSNVYVNDNHGVMTHTGGTINGEYVDNLNQYVTVSFDTNGGTGTMSDQYVKKNTATQIKANENYETDGAKTEPAFTRKGYTFAGWNTKEDGSGTDYNAGESNINISEGTTLYAKWTPNKYTVIWKNWDGTVLDTKENVSAGTTPTYNGATPTKPSDSTNNYYFTGWEPTVDAITGDTTYTATYRSQKQLVINKGNYIRMGAYKDYYVDWFCALQNGTGSLMLTDCALRDMVFGSNSTYKTSNVHNWLDEKPGGICDFATDLGFSQAEMDLAKTLNLSKYGDGTDRFIIPSFEELKGTTYTKAKVIYDQNTTAFAYWLRTYRTSGGRKDNKNERVVRSQYSKVDERYRGVMYDAYVRPMFYLDTAKIKTMPYTGTGTKADPYVFETRQEVAKNVTILGSGAAGGGDVTATATHSDITQRADQKIYSSTLPNKLLTNSEVTVTATPSAGYEFVKMEVLDADNHRLAYTENPENPTATFTLSGNVKVNAVFKKVNTITFYSDIEGTKVWKTVKHTAYEPLTDITPSFNETTGKWSGEYQLSDQNNELFTFGGWATKSGITVWKDDKAGTTAPDKAFDWTQDMPDHDVELYPVWVANFINVRLDLGAYDAVAVADVAAGRYNWYDASRYDRNTPASMGSPTYGDANYQSRNFWKSTNITASTPDNDKYINMTIMNAAQRDGYTLDGWYNSSGMKWEPTYLISREYGDKGANGELNLTYDAPYRNYTYSITLTAKWKLNDAKVTYDVGDGSGAFTDDSSYKLGNIIEIPDGEPTPPTPADQEIEEYVFRGWMDAKGDLHLPGEKFAYSDEALISTHGNPNEIELTAKYQEIPIGTLAFLSQGGSLIDPIKSPVATTVDLTQPEYKPTRSGYTFEGWYTDADCEPEDVVTSIDIIVGVSKRVYAKWTAENHNLFFYFYNGGSLFETITKAYNTDVTAPADPTRTGYTFKGWDKTIPLLMPAQDMTFYGTWDINKRKVIYQLYDDVTNEVEQSYGETVVEPQKPTRDGYTFERWVDTNDVEKTFPFIMPDENVTLTAVWKQNQAAPTGLTVTEASSDVSNDGKIEGVNDTMEYSLDGGKTWIPVPAGETEISGLAPGTVQIRYKATENKNPSPATEVEVKVKAKLFKGHSISLNGDVALNFLIDPHAIGCEDFSGFEKASVTFTWDEGNGEKYGTASVNLKEAPRDTQHPEWFKATCNVVAAHMGYEVFAELYLNGADEPIETDVYSVREYAEVIFDHPEDYVEGRDPVKAANLKKLVQAMLNYGAAAQLAFKGDLADDSVELANSNVGKGEKDYEKVTPAEIGAAIQGSASDMDAVASDLGAKYFTTSLLCLSENKLRVYFTPTTYPGQIPNALNFAGNKKDYYYYVESKAIAAADLDVRQDLSVNGVEIKLSALDYAKELAGDSSMPPEQQNLAKALFLYNQAANAYFGES